MEWTNSSRDRWLSNSKLSARVGKRKGILWGEVLVLVPPRRALPSPRWERGRCAGAFFKRTPRRGLFRARARGKRTKGKRNERNFYFAQHVHLAFDASHTYLKLLFLLSPFSYPTAAIREREFPLSSFGLDAGAGSFAKRKLTVCQGGARPM